MTKTSQKLACVTNTSKLLRPICGCFAVGSIVFFPPWKLEHEKNQLRAEWYPLLASFFSEFQGLKNIDSPSGHVTNTSE